MESRMHRRGALPARMLLSPDEQHAHVRVLNCSMTTCTIPPFQLRKCSPRRGRLKSRLRFNKIIYRQTGVTYYLQCLVDSSPSILKPEGGRKAIDLIRRYAHIFSKSAKDLGRNNIQPHRIDTGDHLSTNQATRRQRIPSSKK